MATYKAISLWQPWASLVALGEKQYETRSWSTNYRGPLVIHAAKRKCSMADINPYNRHFFGEALGDSIVLPYGSALCIVTLVSIRPVEGVKSKLSDEELAFGDYSDGRFAWELTELILFPQPIPMRGRQGLWNVEIEPIAKSEESNDRHPAT